jgi:ABC-type transport system substrate-binding protein
MLRAAPILVLLAALCACGGPDSGGDGEVLLRVVLSHGSNSRPYLPWPEAVAKQVAGDLEEAGFEVEIRNETWSVYLENVMNGRHQMALLGWSPDLPDADNFLRTLLHGDSAQVGAANNISFYRNAEVDSLLDDSRRVHDPARRAELFHRAQERIFADVPMVPLVYTDRRIAYRKDHGPFRVEWVTHPILRLAEGPEDGDLVFLRGGDSKTLDPGDATDGESSLVIEQVYDTLVRYVPGEREVEPSLATSWTADAEKKVWRFEIRKGVRFHDGAPLDAAAVVATFERMRDPKHPFSFPDGSWSNWKTLFAFVDRVEVGAHDMEVVFRCREPAPAFFLQQLAIFSCSIVSPKALAEHGTKIRVSPVGTGPFRFVAWDTGREVHLARNDDVWDGAPNLRNLYFRVAQDPTVRAERLLSGQGADLIDNLGPDTIPRLEQDPGVVVSRLEESSLCYLAMNTMKPPFDDPRVREAVALAINKEGLIRIAYRGFATPATVPVPPGFAGRHDALKDRTRDLARARALLREATSK